MSKESLETKFQCHMNYMQFLMLKNAVPKKWIQKLKLASLENTNRMPDKIVLKKGHRLIDVDKISTKDIYAELVSKQKGQTTDSNRFVDKYVPFLRKL